MSVFAYLPAQGIVGDTGADLTTTLQAAVDRVADDGGGIVGFGPGVHVVERLPTGDNVTLLGPARPTFSEFGDSTLATIKLADGTNDHLVYFDYGTVGVAVRNLAIDGNKANNSGTSDAVHFRDIHDNVTLATSANADDILDTATDHGYSVGDAFRFYNLVGGSNLSTSTTYYVIAANLAARTLQFSTTAGGSATNFGSDVTAGTISDVGFYNHSGRPEVVDCYVFDAVRDGIHMGNGFIGSRVANNWVMRSGRDGIAMLASDCNVVENVVGQAGRHGIYIAQTAIYAAFNNVFQNGRATQPGYGIYVANSGTGYGAPASVSLVGNEIDTNAREGLVIGVGVYGTKVVACAFNGNSFGSTGAGTDPEYQQYAHVRIDAAGASNSIVACGFRDQHSPYTHAKYDIELGASCYVNVAANQHINAPATSRSNTPGSLRHYFGEDAFLANEAVYFADGAQNIHATATPGLMTTNAALRIQDLAAIYSGEGSPEGVQTATLGSIYMDYTNGEAYVKNLNAGNSTGWKLVTHA